MKWWGSVSWLLVSLGLVHVTLGGPGGPPVKTGECSQECIKVYTLHNNQFDQASNYALDACISGCDIFSRIEFDRGTHEPLENLKNCNYSCDDRYEGSLLPACQSGCGFHFDNDVTQSPTPSFRPRSDAPIPIFTRAMGVSQPPMRPIQPSQQPISTLSTPQQPIRSEAPLIPFRQQQNPFSNFQNTFQNSFGNFQNIFRSQGPIIVRKNIPLPMMPRSMSLQEPRPMPVSQIRHMNASPEFPDAEEGPIVTKQIPNGPTVIGFSLPQLLSKVNNLIPQLAQGGAPKIMEISINRNPFSRQDEMDLPELPRMMESLFGRKQVEDIEPLMNEVEDIFGDEEEMEEEIEHFMDENFYGPKEDEVEPLSGLFSQFGRMVNSLPKFDGLRDMMPWSGGVGGGKLTVIKAGPGFHEEKNYDIGADGHISEVKPVSMMNDALEHSNPMDSHFDSEDVEVFTVPHEDITKTESAAEVVENVDAAPVMDVRGLEEQEPLESVKEELKEEPRVSVEEWEVEELPYLSVLRNSVEERARDWSEKMLERYRSLAESEYLDNECSSRNLSWSDWVSCLHAKVGVPRWLTAATISLGIIFSLWLCLVIPSTAPKRKVKTLFIKGEKPSVAVIKAAESAAKAKAKEAEAAGYNPGEYMVAVINVDMPPTYGEVTPGSPAPSYKSDMASQVVPGSPAPSYRSVDTEATKVALEPVHGKKEESNA